MKQQRISVHPSRLITFLLAAVLLLACFTVSTFAENDVKKVPAADESGARYCDVYLSSSAPLDGITVYAGTRSDLRMPKGTKFAQTVTLEIQGAPADATFSVLIPFKDVLYSAGCKNVTAESVYVLDGNTPALATGKNFTVTVYEGALVIGNISATARTHTFMIAPQYSEGLSAWWILAIVLIILAVVLIIMFFVGRYIYKNTPAKVVEVPVAVQPEETPAAPAEEPTAEVFAPIVETTPVDPTLPTMRRLVYIDVMKKPEEYGKMLVREEAGEGVIVYRYRKSYLAKLALADGKIGDYYSIVKNALLHFRGVKARKSWNYEAFNQGRNQIAKIIPNGKTLYLYLAIDPVSLEDTKYGAINVSDKKKFEMTPSLMKIRGDRKLKFALELIEKICGETLELKPLDTPEVNYKPAYQSPEKLLNNGLIRKMAALAPLPEKE